MKIYSYLTKLSIAAPLLVKLVDATLCGCAKSITVKITGIYENGDTDTHYEYCEHLGDGRGFTAGIAGFCTGTGDAWELIKAYHELTGGDDEFTPMDATLEKYAESESDSKVGIEDYCSVFEKLGKTDKLFQKAQDTVRDEMYLKPAQEYAKKLGLKLSITQGQLFDTSIEHGPGTDPDGMATIASETSAKFTKATPGDSGSTLMINGNEVDEIKWLSEFLNVRSDHLTNPRDKANQGGDYWAQTVYRIESYRYAIEQKQYKWGKTPVKFLDNDGNPITVSC